MIWIELLIFLACIIIGARLGGIGLGTIAGIGLLVFEFLFALLPGLVVMISAILIELVLCSFLA